MFIGHYGVSFAARPTQVRLPLPMNHVIWITLQQIQ